MENLYRYIKSVTDANSGIAYEVGDFIWKNPETGYKEWKTSAFLESVFEKMGYVLTKAGNIPGFYTDLDSGRPGPMVVLIGELDSVICKSHPEADPDTGAVHACGHNAQCASLAGAAKVLSDPEILKNLCGKIRFMAVPAEELIEIGFREDLKNKGVIKYYGGKVEFLYRGYFNEADMVVMLHTGGRGKSDITLYKGNNGCVVKNFTYIGKAAHAGGVPHDGINALYAANLGMSAVNALRETFKDEEHVRYHPIMTEGGQAVNIIPESVTLESFVRGANIDSIKNNNLKINRALAASAAAVGANLHIKDYPGYMPLINNDTLTDIAAEAYKKATGEETVKQYDNWSTGSTDMGDLSCVFPVLHASGSGAAGIGHGADYTLKDKNAAYILSSLFLSVVTAALLENNAERAKDVIKNKKSTYNSKEEYFEAIESLMLDKNVVKYNEDGSVTLNFTK